MRPCLRYTVADGDDESTFWFATERPGMPVKSLTRRSGRVTNTVTMVGDSGSRPPDA